MFLIEEELKKLPGKPGVYIMHGEKDEIIYVGKAVPDGARKGGQGDDVDPGTALFKRLTDHAKSIDAATNLKLEDFRCRFLSVDDIWIPLTESLLIERFKPVWNRILDGFGNHDPGKGRHRGSLGLLTSWPCLGRAAPALCFYCRRTGPTSQRIFERCIIVRLSMYCQLANDS